MDAEKLLQLLFRFKGRINRGKYWLAACIYIAIAFILGILIFATGLGLGLFFFVALVFYIPMVVSGIAVGIKRLHDREKSGWWLLIFYLLPVLLDRFGNIIGVGIIFSLASIAISIWGLVELGFLRGTMGSNQYGPDPLAG